MAKLAVNLLLDQLKDAHQVADGTIDGVTDEVASFMPQGKANPISGLFAHVLMSEDFFIHGLLQKKEPLFATSWKNKTGASEVQPTEWETAYPKWLKEVKVEMAQMKEYAKAVYKASEDYVDSLSDEDLERKVDMSLFGMGERPLGSVLGGLIIGHSRDITGEISAIKGIQGLKGYPF